MVSQETDFYKKLRGQFKDWLADKGATHKFADFLMWTPDIFHLLIKLSIDKDVPVTEKAKLAGAIAYFISPLDLIPEAIVGPAGFIDDIALAAYVLNSIMTKTEPEIIKKHWAGDDDIFEITQKILKIADDMIGSGLWKKLKDMVK